MKDHECECVRCKTIVEYWDLEEIQKQINYLKIQYTKRLVRMIDDLDDRKVDKEIIHEIDSWQD